MEANHTPLPWRYSERGNWIFAPIEPKEPIVCEMARIPNYKRNAEFIVRACNSHYELITALDFILNPPPVEYANSKARREQVTKAREMAQAALAKAKGGV